LFCVAYSVTKKCLHTRQLNFEKFGVFNKTRHLYRDVYQKHDKDDIVIEFEMHYTSNGFTLTYYPAVILSRMRKPATYLLYPADKSAPPEVSRKEFIEFLYSCR
uniref:PAZ domain-containing protein n=1 Tax=Haemonchus placei TaxID=6290 RepID=A0A0N4WTX8_HAEPC